MSESTDIAKQDDLEDAWHRREREQDERRNLLMLEANQTLQREHSEREAARFERQMDREHQQIMERQKFDVELREAHRVRDLVRCVWIDTVTNASELPIDDAIARADRLASEYKTRFA